MMDLPRLDLEAKIILHGPDGSGKRLVAKMAAMHLNVKFHEEQVADLFDENIVGTEKRIRSMFAKYSAIEPCLIYMTGYNLFCLLEQPDLDRISYTIQESLNELTNKSTQPIVFIAGANDYPKIFKTLLSGIFQHDISIPSPTKVEAQEIIENIKTVCALECDLTNVLKSYSNGEYYLGNLLNSIAKTEILYRSKRLEPGYDHVDELDDITTNDSIRWTDVGGLEDIKREIVDAIQLALDYPQLKKCGLRRTGILLYGQPGTGKTLLARAVATECNLNFINIKGPELLNEFVGQSEDNVRKLFKKARDMKPSVIFFDEIDSLAPNRGQAGDSAGVMDRMVSQLLAELDGIGKSDDVFVIGATNRVDLIDPSLLRPGRFDKVLEVPFPRDSKDRLEILNALTRKMDLAKDVDLIKLERMIKPNMSGADIQGLCSQALQKSFDRCVQMVETDQKSEDDVEITTHMQDFLDCLN